MPEFFNPDIALGAGKFQTPGGQQQDPFAIVNSAIGVQQKLTDVQRSQVELQTQQQVLAAQKRAGELISKAPTMEEGIKSLLADPLTAGFAPLLYSNLAGTNTSLIAAQGQQMDQGFKGQEQLAKALGAGLSDPSLVGPMFESTLAAMPPDIRAKMGKSVQAMMLSTTANLPPGEAGLAEYQKRVAAISTSVGGLTTDLVRNTLGNPAPSISMQKNAEGAEMPAQMGGPMAGAQPAPRFLDSGAPVKGPTVEEANRHAAEGQKQADVIEEISNDSNAIPITLLKVNNLANALGHFQAGGWADMRGAVAQGLQGLKDAGVDGITNDQINRIANGSLSDTQFFSAGIKPLLVSTLAQAQKGLGRGTALEVNTVLTGMNETNDPKALMDYLNQAKEVLRIGNSRVHKYGQFLQLIHDKDPSVAGFTPSMYNIWFNGQLDVNDLPPSTAGMDLTPIKSENVKGLAPKKGKPSLDELFPGFEKK